MLIKAYGLFWRADDLDWKPGRGNQFRLMGRRGKNRGALRLADFTEQSGLYILYGDYGPYYVGLVRAERLGRRLRSHHETDHHSGNWDRFSWFGFRQVLKARNEEGICQLRRLAVVSLGNPGHELADMEALLIRALGLSRNLNRMNFRSAQRWEQVKGHELASLMAKVSP